MLDVNLALSVMKDTIFVVVDVYFVDISDSGRQRSTSTSWSKGIQLVRENSKFNVKDA